MSHRIVLLLTIFSLCFCLPSFAGYVETTITASGNWTADEALRIPGKSKYRVNVSIAPNSFVGTIKAQRKLPGDASWRDVDSWDFTADTEGSENITDKPEPEDVYYRIGCSSYTSGNATARIGSEK